MTGRLARPKGTYLQIVFFPVLGLKLLLKKRLKIKKKILGSSTNGKACGGPPFSSSSSDDQIEEREKKKTRWKWNERHTRTEPQSSWNWNPRWIQFCQLQSSPGVIAQLLLLPTPEEEPLRFGTNSKFPHILAAPGTSIFSSMHDASQEWVSLSPIKPRVVLRSDGTDAPRTRSRRWNSSPTSLLRPASAARC